MMRVTAMLTGALLLAGCAGSDDPWNGEYAMPPAGAADAAADGRLLGYNDRIYRTEDGPYVCARRDGSAGMVALAGDGALPPALLDEGGTAKLGELLGAAGGDVVRQAIASRALTCE
jgi:hypothetical protein